MTRQTHLFIAVNPDTFQEMALYAQQAGIPLSELVERMWTLYYGPRPREDGDEPVEMFLEDDEHITPPDERERAKAVYRWLHPLSGDEEIRL